MNNVAEVSFNFRTEEGDKKREWARSPKEDLSYWKSWAKEGGGERRLYIVRRKGEAGGAEEEIIEFPRRAKKVA